MPEPIKSLFKKETIEIVKWEMRIDPDAETKCELVGLDSEGNEYRTEQSVYVHGEYFEVEPRFICTQKR